MFSLFNNIFLSVKKCLTSFLANNKNLIIYIIIFSIVYFKLIYRTSEPNSFMVSD